MRFIKNSIFFFALPAMFFLYLFFCRKDIGINEDLNRRLLKEAPREKNLIIMGDSKPLVDFNYKILKDSFPGYHIINLSIWARNPLYIYSVYKDILESKKISHSIIIYSSGFFHTLNRDSTRYNKIGAYNLSRLLKITIKGPAIKYDFHPKIDSNGFVSVNEQNFGNVKDAKLYYQHLMKTYPPDFITQINYIKKIENLFDKTNTFLVAQLPGDSTVNRVENEIEYCRMYEDMMKENFGRQTIYAGYLKELDNKDNWYNTGHLNSQGTRAFTPIFCHQLKQKLAGSTITY